jgi:hypothetical protein
MNCGVRKDKRGKARGGAVVCRTEARVDGHSSPREKKVVFQVSKAGEHGMQGVNCVGHYIPCKYCNI